jgi:hypothetical protein
MTLKSVVSSAVRYALLATVYFLLSLLTSNLVPVGLDWAPSPEEQGAAVAGMLLAAAVTTLVISLIITRSSWRGWRLVGAVALAWYGCMTIMSQIETIWFAPALGIPTQVGFAVLVNHLVLVALFTPFAVFVWGQLKAGGQELDASQRLPLTLGEWAWKLALLAGLYLVLYFGFGYVVAWQNPALREMYAGGANAQVFNAALLFPLQIARGVMWVLFALPVIRMTRGPGWQVALLVGFLYALPMNIGHFIPNPIMPDATVRMSHFVETATSNFIYGLAVTWLLAWRPAFALGKPGVPAG